MTTHSTEIHGVRHALMRLPKSQLKLPLPHISRLHRIGRRRRDVRFKQVWTHLRVIMIFGTHADVVRVVDWCRNRNRARATCINVAECKGERLKAIRREAVLINENVVVPWPARAENSGMAIEIVVKLDRAYDIPIDDRARGAVAAAVHISRGKEYNLVVFSNHNEGDCGIKPYSFACAADATELFINDDLEFGFGDAVAIEQYALRKLVICFLIFFEHGHTHVLYSINEFPMSCLNPEPRDISCCVGVNTPDYGTKGRTASGARRRVSNVPTHDHRRVCRVSEERNILGFGYDVCPAELHIHSDVIHLLSQR